MLDEEIQEEKSAIEKGQETVQKTKNTFEVFKKMLHFIKAVIMAFTTPAFWIILFAIILLYILVSLSYVVGPLKFGSVCSDNGAPSIERVEAERKSSVIGGYLSADEYISKDSAAYLAQLAEKYKNNFSMQTGVPNGCSTKCLQEKMLKGDNLDNVKLGPFKLSGANAQALITRAIAENKEWTDSSVQLATLKVLLSNEGRKNNSAIGQDNKTKDSIKQINKLLGLQSNGKDVEEYAKKTKEFLKNIKGDISGCVQMGTGKGKGRTEGGSATDNSGFGGSIDASGLIAFLESFCSEHKISTPGSFGAEQATDAMKEAKRMAEEKGGADPSGNIYSSCDRLAATGMKNFVDPDFPWGNVAAQVNYMESNPSKYQKVSNCERQSGDIITWSTGRNGHGHIAIFGVNQQGQEMVYQASFKDYLPYKSKAFDCNYSGGGRTIQYWRPIQ